MSNTTITSLTALASVANDDEVPIWDASAAQTKKITVTNLLAGRLTGTGVIATGTFTLTVPETGIAALLATANVFTVAQVMQQVRSGASGSIATNGVISFTAPKTRGLVILAPHNSGGMASVCGLFVYDTSAGSATVVVAGANLENASGILTGTTGTNSKVTVSAHTNGLVYIENRLAYSVNFAYLCI